MLMEQKWRYRLTDFDSKVFDALLPADNPLLDALNLIDWDSFLPILDKYYVENRGQPAISPVVMLKLEFLRYQFGLSDIQVMLRADTDILFRWFLQVPIKFQLPHSSLLCRFRGRLGSEGFKEVFDQIVRQARKAGLVKDRLRIKDASHVIANIAIPTTIKLFGQLRDRLLEQLSVFDPEAAEGFRLSLLSLRKETTESDPASRLENRVKLLQDILNCVSELTPPSDAKSNRAWLSLLELKTIAEKVLRDQANPEEGRRLLSLVDPEARRGKHHVWYEGYVIDVMMDADSEIITQIQVLEAGGDEAKSAVELVKGEQETHGNQIQEISIDGAGFNGEMLRALESELKVEVAVPPKKQVDSEVFPNTAFTLNEEGSSVTCPAGQTSSYQQTDSRQHGKIFRFKRSQCDGCPLVSQCMPKPQSGAFGRSVCKNEYEAEYNRAREKAKTAHYKSIRKEHPAIERKLNEILNHHDGRHAKYWGIAKLKIQELMTCFTVNVKRISKLAPRAEVSHA